MSTPAARTLRGLYDKVSGACVSRVSDTHTCNLSNIKVEACSNVEALCCNDARVGVLTCESEAQVAAYAADAVMEEVAADPRVAGVVQDYLKRRGLWDPTVPLRENLLRFLSQSCANSVDNRQEIDSSLHLRECDRILIMLYNRSSVEVQCVAGKVSQILDDGGGGSGGGKSSLPASTWVAIAASVVAAGLLAWVIHSIVRLRGGAGPARAA